MSKKFWMIIISFWLFCLIAGTISYRYIVHSQEVERKLFVAQYNYEKVDEEVDEEIEQELPPITAQYPLKSYSKSTFLQLSEESFQKIQQLETSLQQFMNAGDKDSAIKVALEGYEKTKSYIEQFGNNEFTDATTLESNYFEKMAYHLHYYAKYASLYFIVSAKKMKGTSETLEQQQTAALESLTSAKKAFTRISAKYKGGK